MMTNKLEFYVDLWHNFYKSELLENVTISDADNVHFGSYAESFYNISGTIDVNMMQKVISTLRYHLMQTLQSLHLHLTT